MIVTRRVGMLGVFLLLGAAPALADTHGWVVCTPGSFHSCHSVSLMTTPIMSGTTRTGTQITISVTNLQGTAPQDNTPWSYLEEVFFYQPERDPGQPFMDHYPVGFGTPSGGATGSQWAQFADVNVPGYGSYFYLNYLRVGGCSQLIALPGYTCGGGAVFAFSWSSAVIGDAGAFALDLNAVDEFGNEYRCLSDPSAFRPDLSYPACDVLRETRDVVPEPITIALLGTGLVGVGGFRLRGRRKPQ